MRESEASVVDELYQLAGLPARARLAHEHAKHRQPSTNASLDRSRDRRFQRDHLCPRTRSFPRCQMAWTQDREVSDLVRQADLEKRNRWRAIRPWMDPCRRICRAAADGPDGRDRGRRQRACPPAPRDAARQNHCRIRRPAFFHAARAGRGHRRLANRQAGGFHSFARGWLPCAG